MDGPRNRGYGARRGYDIRTRCVCGCTECRQSVSPGKKHQRSGEAGTASLGHGSFVFDRLFLPMLLSHAYKDKDGQEAAIVLLW